MVRRARGRPRHDDVLTPAEWRVLHWVRHGLSRRQVAHHLATTEDAIKYHVRNIRAKLQLPDQAALRQWTGHPANGALAQHEEVPVAGQTEGISGIGQISLLIRDTERATAFFRETLGLKHLYSFGDLVFFDCGGTRLYLHRVPDDQWRPGSIIYFQVPDIEAHHRELADRGVAFEGAPHLVHRHDSGVEEWMAFFSDLEGNNLALMSQVRPTT
jgi:DNA-binding CsgD family transcriptional regulator/catechol 2,3-dioxygenase-like lactoylglutathione lyase family enzyme